MNIFQSYRSFGKVTTLVLVVCFLSVTKSWSQNTPLKTVTRPMTVSAVPQGVIAFRAAATYVSGEPVASNTEKKVDFTGAYFDESKNFSVATDEFVAPSDGIYHFDLRVSWAQFTAPGMVTLLIRTNLYEQIAITSVQISSTTQLFDSNFSSLAKLKAGDKVSVYLQQNSGTQQHYRQVVFGGFKLN
jgi:C1q domain